MPVSKKQLAWAHTPSGQKALGSKTVENWDQEVKGHYNELPEKASPETSAKLEKQYSQPTGKRFKA